MNKFQWVFREGWIKIKKKLSRNKKLEFFTIVRTEAMPEYQSRNDRRENLKPGTFYAPRLDITKEEFQCALKKKKTK